MPDLLGPTNPVPTHDVQAPRITTPQPTDTSIQNIANPNVVTRPDQKPEQQGSGDSTGPGAARYESNFMTFLQRLRGNSAAAPSFLGIMLGTQVSSGIRAGFAEELASLLDFLKMDEGQLLNFLKTQIQSGSRFSGALFQALRNAFGSSSELVQNEILQFLRRYSDNSSTEHLEGKMLRTVDDMRQAMPSRWGNQVNGMLEQLEKLFSAGDRKGAMELLRGSLFPLVSNYVSTTHDHGLARNLLSMLTLDVARYENGGEAGMLQSLRHLSALGVLPEELSKLGDRELLDMLRNTDFARASRNNGFADRIADLIDKALQGKGGVEVQEAFHNMMNAILINESVYMPLQHVMLPLDWNGNLMFSEMWVDPDAEREGPPRRGEERTMKMLIKMDIRALGSFDLLIRSRGSRVAMQVACPPTVAPFSEAVSATLRDILTRNGLEPVGIEVGEMRRSVPVSDVFPRIFERMGGVNVKV